MFENRTYRSIAGANCLVSYRVTVNETDLFVQTDTAIPTDVYNAVIKYRNQIELYAARYPLFVKTLKPFKVKKPAPDIVCDMIKAGIVMGTGPMAAVAGVIAEYTARDIFKLSQHIIIENGGDIFLKTDTPITMAIHAGNSPLNMKIGLRFNCDGNPFSVCTSSGTIGHSLSMGIADAVTVISDSGALADTAATKIGNLVKGVTDIEFAINYGKKIDGIKGLVIIIGEKIGAWGDVELVEITTK